MALPRVLIFLAFAAILGIPFALRPAAEREPAKDAAVLVVITPHVPQIHYEFGLAFDRWYFRKFNKHVRVDWRYAGTSEILKQLEAQYTAALKAGQFDLSDPKNPKCSPGLIGYDLMFGGGTYDHGRVKNGVTFSVQDPESKDGKKQIKVPMSVPAGFDQRQLDEWFGENNIGVQPLYDPEQYWIGTALSSFGIVYNRDVLKRLGLKEPTIFEDLTDPRYAGWIALADPRQSGSVATSFDSILNNYGWDKGWRILRDMCANTRYFTNSSPKTPIDVSAGEAAAGLAIDFYGRGQAQAVMRPGETAQDSRVGYSDPSGAVYIDADPISILRGGPNFELAKLFTEFCLTDEGQSLWQYRAANDPGSATSPKSDSGEKLGPQKYELRRLPVRRIMYTPRYFEGFIDKVDPFAIASKTPVKGWRSAILVMMGAFAIDIADDQREAWAALNRARDAKSPSVSEMESLFYAWPKTKVDDPRLHPLFSKLADDKKKAINDSRLFSFGALKKETGRVEPAGGPLTELAAAGPEVLDFSAANIKTIQAAWKNPDLAAACKVEYTKFFRGNYRRVVELSQGRR
jgi:ABC-type Fe3+ transport system substrate-binding protein